MSTSVGRPGDADSGGRGSVLGRAALLARLAADPPLVQGLVDVERQVQPHGIDFRLDSVWQFGSPGALGRDGAPTPDRVLPEREALPFDASGALWLVPGAYGVQFVEVIHLPTDLMALARPRSTLLRCGAALHTAVWDAGYAGRSEALLVVSNPHGLRLERGARLCQLVFFLLDASGPAYRGAYQGENLGGRT